MVFSLSRERSLRKEDRTSLFDPARWFVLVCVPAGFRIVVSGDGTKVGSALMSTTASRATETTRNAPSGPELARHLIPGKQEQAAPMVAGPVVHATLPRDAMAGGLNR